MTVFHALRTGFGQAARSKRMVIFAWSAGLVLSLALAVPLLRELERYIGPTVLEEQMLERLDDNALATLRLDLDKNELVRWVDAVILGWTPFLDSYQDYLRGTAVKVFGGFLMDVVFAWEMDVRPFGLLTMMVLLYSLLWTFLSGGFVGLYGLDEGSDMSAFFRSAARYFGRFFRLSLLALILFTLLFRLVLDPLQSGIARWTANEPSELTPFVYYILKNILAVVLLGLTAMCLDFAKVRIVLEERRSSLLAFGAGAVFSFRNVLRTGPLYLILAAIAMLLMTIFALIDSVIPRTGYWTVAAALFLSQVYVIVRTWLKAAWYASGVHLFRQISSLRARQSFAPAATGS